MLLIDILKEQKDFSPTETAISNYILDNIPLVCQMNISELADKTFCSVATISRFCKKMHHGNFSQFKLKLGVEQHSLVRGQKRIEYDFFFNEDATKEDISEAVDQLSHQTLNDCSKTIDSDKIFEAAKLIDQADQIDIFATGNSIVTGLDFHHKLLWIGKNTNFEFTQGFQNLRAQVHSHNRLAIIFSYFGTSRINIEIVKSLQAIKVPYILVTGPKYNPLCIHAKVCIQVSPVEADAQKIGPISSRIAMTYVSDLLYSSLFSLNYKKNKETLEIHLQNIQLEN